MAARERAFLGVSPSDRRAERRARLIEAALDLIGEAGVSALTMTQVAHRAGLTERYFYESFADRSALLVAAFDASVADMDRLVFAAGVANATDLEAVSRATASAIVSVLSRDPRKARLFVESIGNEALRERRSKVIARYARYVAVAIRASLGLGPRAHEARLRVASYMLVGGLSEGLAGWVDGSLDTTPEAIIGESTRLTVALAATFATQAGSAAKLRV